jgi:two-component system, chemotaxis family, chemotaxis protein CheY
LNKAIVVDDSRAVRMILARILRELNFEVAEAGDGKQGLSMLEANPAGFRLALVDWNMPVMNGFDMLKALRADPVFQSLIIVMVTTETEMGRMVLALEAGANEYVMKPFTKDILVSKLEYVGALSSGVSA